MWGALKKDFGEFVTTVGTDTIETLAKIDTGLNDGSEEGPSAALIDPDTGMVIEATNTDDDHDEVGNENGGIGSNVMKRPDQLTVEEKKLYLMTCEAVFLDELVSDVEESEETNEDNQIDDADEAAKAEVKAFLEQFDIETKTEVISKLLEEFPGTLQVTFSNLSDQVEYADFWKRYFYRLADERVEATYEKYYAVYQEQAALKKESTGPSALSGVTNFLGGVVNRLVEENDIDDIDNDDDVEDEDVDEDEGNFVGANTASSAMNFLKGVGSGRPPFVMNTAVSDDDDDDDDDEDGQGKAALKLAVSDDDDEELGWDDDDDDEEEVDGGVEDAEETLEFNDAEKENLQEELQQAQEERDMLHKTVEMQAEEIKKLQEATRPELVTGGDEEKQVDLMKMQLFEKDSELAALRAQVEDLKQEKEEIKTSQSMESQEFEDAEVERLNGTVDELKMQVFKLKAEAKKANSLQTELEETKAARDSLQSELASLQRMSQDTSKEKDQATQTLLNQKDAEISQLQQDLSDLQVKVTTSADQTATLKEELKSVQTNFESSTKDADDLRKKLASYEQTISQLRVDLHSSQEMSKAREAEDSDSTGVKVSTTRSIDELPEATPSPPVPATTDIQPDADVEGGDENDDEWGEDW